MEKIIDARGLACPKPVIEARKVLQNISHGSLKIIVDNEIAVQNLKKMAKQMGLEYRVQTASVDKYQLEILIADSTRGEVPSSTNGKTKSGTIVVLASNLMGEGDPKLGEVLMRGFVYALTEMQEYPEKILLYNSGVKLAVAGSQSLRDLWDLAEQGVEVLSCGTCLDYYQLLDELAVGSVTNMYEIGANLLNAKRIIKP